MVDKLLVHREVEHRTKDVVLRNHIPDLLVGEIPALGESNLVFFFQFRETLAEHVVSN